MADEVQTPLITKDKRDMTVASELFEKNLKNVKLLTGGVCHIGKRRKKYV